MKNFLVFFIVLSMFLVKACRHNLESDLIRESKVKILHEGKDYIELEVDESEILVNCHRPQTEENMSGPAIYVTNVEEIIAFYPRRFYPFEYCLKYVEDFLRVIKGAGKITLKSREHYELKSEPIDDFTMKIINDPKIKKIHSTWIIGRVVSNKGCADLIGECSRPDY